MKRNSESFGIQIDKNTGHTPVLLNEVINGLNLKKGDIVFDGTLGGGGYFKRICQIIGKDGLAIGTDQDADAIERVNKTINACKECVCQKKMVNKNFKDVDVVLEEAGVDKIQGFVLDLGLSSDHFEKSGRGFSFQKNEPLLMTLSRNEEGVAFTAKEIINDWDEENIADILYAYGEEKFSRRIAKEIVEARKEKEVETTFDLIEILEKALPVWYRKGRRTHFATKTFQALRIAVNDELGVLNQALEKGFEALEIDGRMAIVSFHSLEDRIVKNFMKSKKDLGVGEIIYKKPIAPSEEEIALNPRSRSAKLRVIKKIK